MTPRLTSAVLGMTWIMLVGLGRAQDDQAVAAERDPNLVLWPWMVDVIPTDLKSRWHVFHVPPAVFGKTSADLHDLRLADANGERVPYVLRVLNAKSELTPVAIVRQFDAAPSEKNRFYQVSLELGEVGPGHNEIEIEATGKNFHRHVQVFGDKSERFDDPRPLLDKFLVDYDTDSGPVIVKRFGYSLTQFRFLQVRVDADPGTDKEVPKISKVVVRRKIVTPGVYSAMPMPLQGRQDVRADDGPGSAWFIDFGEPLPCERLRFKVTGDAVERPHLVQIANPNQPRQDVFGGEWHWRRGKDEQTLEIALSREVYAQRLRFVVTDYANPPLDLRSVEALAAARQVIFELPADKYALPLRLYFGNPSAGPARYDLEKTLPLDLQPAPATATVGPRQSNPAYVPPVRPLHERQPWVIYLVLGIGSAVLLGLLGLLGRQALARSQTVDAEKGKV